MKMSISRRKIFTYLSATAGVSALHISNHLQIPRHTVRNSLQWLRRYGVVSYWGVWAITDKGKSWLQQDPSIRRELKRHPPLNTCPSFRQDVDETYDPLSR